MIMISDITLIIIKYKITPYWYANPEKKDNYIRILPKNKPIILLGDINSRIGNQFIPEIKQKSTK